jgi:hypothetical protein
MTCCRKKTRIYPTWYRYKSILWCVNYIRKILGKKPLYTIGKITSFNFPMVRSVFPRLIVDDLVGIQPLTTTTTLAYSLKFTKQRWYNKMITYIWRT